MNGLILALAMIGQQCPTEGALQFAPTQWGSRPSRQFGGVFRGRSNAATPAPRRPVPPGVKVIPVGPGASKPNSSMPITSTSRQSVRIAVKSSGRSYDVGSGTIVAVEAGMAYVVTARHVVEGIQGPILIRHLDDEHYTGELLAVGSGGDLAVIKMDAPPGAISLQIAPESPKSGFGIGWGPGRDGSDSVLTGTLHRHDGSFIGKTTTESGKLDDLYSFYPEQGDSGGGFFNAEGQFAGVIWAQEPRRHAAIVVSCSKIHDLLNATVKEVSGKRIVTICPFFLKFRREWGDSPSQPTPEPVTPPSPVLQAGPQGPVGPQGPPGAAGTSPDPNAIAQAVVSIILKEIQGNPAYKGAKGDPGPAGPAGAAGKDATAAAPPAFMFRIKKPDGTVSPAVNLLTTDSNGKPVYALELDGSQLSPTTVPVTTK